MDDLVFALVTIAFFGLTAWMAFLFEKLRTGK
jgi:hypothetical protein